VPVGITAHFCFAKRCQEPGLRFSSEPVRLSVGLKAVLDAQDTITTRGYPWFVQSRIAAMQSLSGVGEIFMAEPTYERLKAQVAEMQKHVGMRKGTVGMSG